MVFKKSFLLGLFVMQFVWVAAQSSIKITVHSNNTPVEDAIVTYYPLGDKNFSKVAITDSKGETTIKIAATIVLQISKLGYAVFIDTLTANTSSKKYVLHQTSVNINDVVITGQMGATRKDESIHRIKIVDRKRIEQQGAVNLRDLLTNELNVRITQDAVLGSQISLMGMSGQNVKILIDGVPVIGRMDGNIDISQFNLNNVERVEIIEGPMSVIYGSDALGGVINLISRKPMSKICNLNANFYYDRVGTYNADASAGFRAKDLQLSVSGGRNYFDGFSINEDEKIRWKQWKPKEQYFGDMQLRYRFGKQSHRIFSQYFQEKITNRNAPIVTPYSALGFDDYFYTTRLNNSLYSDFYFNNKATLNLINSYSFFDRIKNTYRKDLTTGNSVITPNPNDQDTTTFSLFLSRFTYTTHNSSFYNVQMGYDVNYETGTGKKLTNNYQEQGDFAGFFISDIKASSRLSLRQGLRFIYNTRYKAPVVSSFNIKYDINSNLMFRGSYAQGFRAPSLKELFLYFVDVNHNIQGNGNLKAETSNNYQASLSYRLPISKSEFRADATVFYNAIENLITLAITDAATQTYSYINVGEYKTQGVNLSAGYNMQNIKAGVGYSYTGRYNQLSTTSTVDPFSYASEVNGTLTYGIPSIKTEASIFYKYNGQVPGFAFDANGSVIQTFVQPYSISDVSLTKRFFKNILTITIGCKNLFDVTNINYSSTASTHTSSATTMPAGMGRYLFTTIRLSYETK